MTCAHCARPVGILSGGIARPYRIELTADGVSTVCDDNLACKLARH
jgi:hypothetical protein